MVVRWHAGGNALIYTGVWMWGTLVHSPLWDRLMAPLDRSDRPSYEVELKVRAAHAAVLARLAPLEAREEARVAQEDTYYRAPHRDLARSDEALRLRREEGDGVTHRLTYKGPKVGVRSKTRVEHEVGIDDPGAMEGALRALGFEPAAVVRKVRREFSHRGCRIALDTVDGLGEFVEVEARAREGDREEVEHRARRVLAELGLDPERQIRASYLELMQAT